MPEPLITESITDLDGTTAGEVEVDLDGLLGTRRDASGDWQGSVEIEWRAIERLGLSLELDLGGPLRSSNTVVAGQAAASWVLLHNRALDFHVMAELSARVPATADSDAELGDGAMPVNGGVRAGIRVGEWTSRAFLGWGVGAVSAHPLPLRLEAALLYDFPSIGFLGLETRADWSVSAPWTVAPNVVLRGRRFGIPFDIGVAAPWSVGARAGEPQFGILARLILEFDAD